MISKPPTQTDGAVQIKPAATWVLLSLSMAMLLSSLGTSITNVALPTLAQVFDVSFQAVQWVVLAYLLAITSLIVGAGRLGDIMGRRRLLLAGIGLFSVASSLCAAAPTLWLLIAARALQGLGAAMLMALTMALVGEAVPKEKTGSAMGLLGTMSAVGTTLGPTLGGVLIGSWGWQAIFWVNVPLGALTFLLVWRYLPMDHPGPKTAWASFDGPGTLLLALTLVVYALAMTLGRGNFGWFNAALLLTAVLGAGVFVWVENRARSPLIQWAMVSKPVPGIGFVTSTLVTTVVMATLVVGPFYLSAALQLEAAHVGLVMSAGPVVAALTGVPAGRFVDRLGAHTMGLCGLATMLVGSTLLALQPMAWGVAGYVLPLVVVTAGYALFQAANNTAVMRDVPAERRGVVSGLLGLSRNLGLITGASVMGAVFVAGSGVTEITTARPEQIAAGLHATFAVAVGLVLVALAVGRQAR
ncbi:MFS transporter [Rhodoferax sp. U11-2br]|uniref:MFS transporter n=1 Tax=Rhodoferax sp. U11-2br TaxID=2838878 RepID=UPI001BE4FB59|nr:MFS transporter [Rhodoferax sp. U11-2br]MBT3067439.1 MFS transporter [Rhodoferax sp. U11-2br]